MKVGLTGDITLNDNGDREVSVLVFKQVKISLKVVFTFQLDYTLNDFNPENNLMRPVASYYGIRRVMERLPNVEIYWPKDFGPPADIPHCGFMGDAPHCLPKGNCCFCCE